MSAFVIGGRRFLGSVKGVCSVIGHIGYACVWYVSMTYFDALSMCVGVTSFEMVRSCI